MTMVVKIFKSGSIGGFTLTDTEISQGLSLKSSGQITGSNVLFDGGVITSDVTILGSVASTLYYYNTRR